MCYDLVERYIGCNCIHYEHGLNKCAAYGTPGHHITTRTILVSERCDLHYVPPDSPEARSDFSAHEASSRSSSTHAELDIFKHRAGATFSIARNLPTLTINRSQSPYRQGMNQGSSGTKSQTEDGEPGDISTNNEDSNHELPPTEGFPMEDSDKFTSTPLKPFRPRTLLKPLTEKFTNDECLRNLWLQIARRSPSAKKVKEEVSLLILRYSADLGRLAGKEAVLHDRMNLMKVSQFVERKRRYLSRKIYGRFWVSPLVIDQPVNESNDVSDDDFGVKYDPDNSLEYLAGLPTILKTFLFEAEPFSIFKENVRIFVEQSRLGPPQTTWIDSLRIGFDNAVVLVNGKSAQRGMRRLHCVCNCGLRLYDDYTETQSGALNDLEKILSNYGIRSRGPGDIESNNPGLNKKSNQTSLRDIWSSFAPKMSPPRFWLRKDYWEPGKCRQVHDTSSEQEHNYLLACLPFGRWVSKLHQQEICAIHSDQEFFAMLRTLYRNKRHKISLSWMKRVRGIEFVQFDVHRSEIAAVRSKPALPPEDLRDQYLYDPMPAHLIPPIGPNMLAHFFENPTHASVLPDLYRRIPKKLRQKLTPCQVTGLSVGWGIEFVECVDYFMLFMFGCLCFLACSIVAVLWSTIKQDVQGGVGIGAFIFAFTLFCGGLVHSALDSYTLK
ncbi:uncharacterized protein F4812DRAFT_160035 [Daldinia caldariorum]|uniref:uncharacterized protein n=1 Tax=Daldinia caldariorum TaxID=326644 RepID=UPI0020076308|nr:uncharacterized protein F4812DRAFT_160035 [Daldinia caldariorum]KAI1464568.1 hypothetical protein F4812DRAFT_160035 [Daldinia caldariorum]